MNLVSNFDYIRIISVSLIWIIEDDRLDRKWELWSSNESIHNTVVHLSLYSFQWNQFIQNLFSNIYSFSKCVNACSLARSSSISRGNVPRSRASELMQHELAIFHVIFIVRDDIMYIPFLRISGKSIHRERAAPSNSTLDVNFHRDATYLLYILHRETKMTVVVSYVKGRSGYK